MCMCYWGFSLDVESKHAPRFEGVVVLDSAAEAYLHDEEVHDEGRHNL